MEEPTCGTVLIVHAGGKHDGNYIWVLNFDHRGVKFIGFVMVTVTNKEETEDPDNLYFGLNPIDRGRQGFGFVGAFANKATVCFDFLNAKRGCQSSTTAFTSEFNQTKDSLLRFLFHRC